MKKIVLIALTLLGTIALSSCEYDNFDEPQSRITGHVVFEDVPVGVRTNGTRLELWEDGHILRTPMNVHIAQDGSFSAVVFDGTYKLVRKGEAPWLPQATDTVVVDVKGHTSVDIAVTPYFTIGDVNFEKTNNTVNAKFSIHRVVNTAELDQVRLYLGKNILTDQNQREVRVEANLPDVSLDAATVLTAEIPENLRNLGFVFARIGVKSKSSSEYMYSPVQRIDLR